MVHTEMPCSSSTNEHHFVALALGSNLGQREQLLQSAVALLSQEVGPLCCVSSFIGTLPLGFTSQHLFLNGALTLHTPLSLEELLAVTQRIERELGRTHKHKEGESYTDRTVDIDILLYDDVTVSLPHLQVPHPRMAERLFVLEPLASIAPQLLHPTLHKTILQLYHEHSLSQ